MPIGIGAPTRYKFASAFRAPIAVRAARPAAVALDVEFVHLRRQPGSVLEAAEVSLAAWVAMVDEAGAVVLDHRVALAPLTPALAVQPGSHPSSSRPQQPPVAGGLWVGGVPLRQLQGPGALPLPEVAAKVKEAARGRTLVGHGLHKDLAALGLGDWRPQHWYDTLTTPAFQARGGNARSLRRLAEQHLGLKGLHEPGKRHSAVEDARVLMQLYCRVALPSLPGLAGDDYDSLVALYTRQLLAAAPVQLDQDS
ncbi:hypothetical protein V8C86DRAFT_2644750 [Haematococcus lacustris]